MNNIIKMNKLYDVYGILLTDSERKYYEDYYFYNETYTEIAEKYGVSKNAVSKNIINASNKLLSYEEKLKIVSRNEKINDIISNIDDNIKEKIQELL